MSSKIDKYKIFSWIIGVVVILIILAVITAIDWILIVFTYNTIIFIPILIICIVGTIAAFGWCIVAYFNIIED